MKKSVSLLLTVIIILSVLLSTGCNTTDTTEYLTLDSIIQSVNEKHLNELQTPATYDEAEYLIDYDNEVFTEDEKSALLKGEYNRVTKEEAKQDIETLFKFLKHYYAGYTYFGGDEKFDKAKQEILSNIDSSAKNKFNKNDLRDIILPSLSLVYDSHFSFEGMQTFKEAHTYHESSKMEFYKDSKGYYTKIDEKMWYLPTDLERYLKVTIGKSGELVYGMFAVVVDESTLPSELELYNNSQKNKINLTWTISEVGGDQSGVSKYTEENGVPISSLAYMDLTNSSKESNNDFLNNSLKHAEKENSILDLRDNSGGVVELDMLWVYGYTGEMSDINWKQMYFLDEAFANAETDEYYDVLIDLDIVKNNPEVTEFFSKSVDEIYSEKSERISNGAYDINLDNLIENKNKLFVLQSERSYSSAEHFVELLHNVENVLTVGTNTNGCIHTGAVAIIGLPNCGLGFSFSQAINIGPDKELDIYGIEPDIYIASEDAQEAVLRCIEYYKEK